MFGLFSCDIGVDLGTANTLVHVAGQGIVINEPTVVAMDRKNDRVTVIGGEAKKMLGRTPGNLAAIRPMKDGVIADFQLVEILLSTFIKRVQKYPLFCKTPGRHRRSFGNYGSGKASRDRCRSYGWS